MAVSDETQPRVSNVRLNHGGSAARFSRRKKKTSTYAHDIGFLARSMYFWIELPDYYRDPTRSIVPPYQPFASRIPVFHRLLADGDRVFFFFFFFFDNRPPVWFVVATDSQEIHFSTSAFRYGSVVTRVCSFGYIGEAWRLWSCRENMRCAKSEGNVTSEWYSCWCLEIIIRFMISCLSKGYWAIERVL